MKRLKFSVRRAQLKVQLSQVNTAPLLLQSQDFCFFFCSLLSINTSSMQKSAASASYTPDSPFCIILPPLFSLVSFAPLPQPL